MKATTAAVTPTKSNHVIRTVNTAAIVPTSVAVAPVMGLVRRPITRMARWNDSNTDMAGRGASSIVGRIANAARSRVRPEMPSYHTADSGVNAIRANPAAEDRPRTRANRASSG